jgi:hypothetical protein
VAVGAAFAAGVGIGVTGAMVRPITLMNKRTSVYATKSLGRRHRGHANDANFESRTLPYAIA